MLEFFVCIKQNAELGQRSRPNLNDVRLALAEFGISARDLETYLETLAANRRILYDFRIFLKYSLTAIPRRLGSRPQTKTAVKMDPDFTFQDFRYEKTKSKPAYVSVYCPVFPSSHTFKFSKVGYWFVLLIILHLEASTRARKECGEA